MRSITGGRQDSALAIQRKEWSLATPVLSKSVLPKKRKTSTKPADLKAQPDADKTLNTILSRLDDMKAEETVTIDLRGKSAFSDYMIVTSGRANRHVGAIAENVAKGLKKNGIKSANATIWKDCGCRARRRRRRSESAIRFAAV